MYDPRTGNLCDWYVDVNVYQHKTKTKRDKSRELEEVEGELQEEMGRNEAHEETEWQEEEEKECPFLRSPPLEYLCNVCGRCSSTADCCEV